MSSNELKGMGRKWSWPALRNCSIIRLKEFPVHLFPSSFLYSFLCFFPSFFIESSLCACKLYYCTYRVWLPAGKWCFFVFTTASRPTSWYMQPLTNNTETEGLTTFGKQVNLNTVILILEGVRIFNQLKFTPQRSLGMWQTARRWKLYHCDLS